jgi:hypothetical protein
MIIFFKRRQEQKGLDVEIKLGGSTVFHNTLDTNEE